MGAKVIRIASGSYIVKGINADIDIYKKDVRSWVVSGNVVGEFWRSTVESYKEARRIAIEAAQQGITP